MHLVHLDVDGAASLKETLQRADVHPLEVRRT
jgi:hypothetical protein